MPTPFTHRMALVWFPVLLLLVPGGALPTPRAWAQAVAGPPARPRRTVSATTTPQAKKRAYFPTDIADDVGLLLTVRLVTWPVMMAITAEDEYPQAPILEASFGMRRRWFELSLGVGIAMRRMLDKPGTYFGLSVNLGFFSLRRDSVRLRHGLTLGLISEAPFERRVPPESLTPLPIARIQLLELLIRLGRRWWLEISALTLGYPSLYEASLGFRFEFADPAEAGTFFRSPTPAPASRPGDPARPATRFRPFGSVEMGLLWWHHFEPLVLGSTFGRVGFRYGWFETALGFGSPAWASWRTRGLYELFVDLGLYSLRRTRVRLRHQARLGVLFHNPPFELHTWSGLVMHLDPCLVALGLGRGFWLELSPIRISIAPRGQLSTAVALRYEL